MKFPPHSFSFKLLFSTLGCPFGGGQWKNEIKIKNGEHLLNDLKSQTAISTLVGSEMFISKEHPLFAKLRWENQRDAAFSSEDIRNTR